MSSSSGNDNFLDFYNLLHGDWPSFRDNTLYPNLLDLSSQQFASWLDDQFYNDTGNHLSSSDKTAIQSAVRSTAMQFLTDKVGSETDTNVWDINWDHPYTGGSYPTGLEMRQGVSLDVTGGPISWKIGGDISLKWSTLIDNLKNSNFSNLNPVNNVGITATFTSTDFYWSASGGVSGTIDAPAAGFDHTEWHLSFKIGIKW